MEFKVDTITDAYSVLIYNLINKGEKVNNTIELTNVHISIERPSLDVLRFIERKISFKYLMTELSWYWSGSNSCEEIGKVAKKWLEISDDGKTSNSAYGYIILKKYHNQLEEVIKLLSIDPYTRRAVLNISDPAIDKIKTKDMQCTIAIQFLYRNEKLDMIVYMRSNDAIFGFTYDSIYFETIHQYIAKRLNVKVGKYEHNASSFHIYEKDIDKLTNDSMQYFTLNWLEIINQNYI